MEILSILNRLEENQVYISLDGNDLEVNFMDDEVSDEIIDLLKANKEMLVSHLGNLQNTNDYQEIPQIETQTSYVLSSSQMRLWVLSQFDEASLAYNLPFSLDLKGNYDVQLLNKAIQAAIERHEILRTVFRTNEDEEVRQWVIPTDQFKFKCQFHDLSVKEDARAIAERMITEDTYQYFDLENGPLFRAAFFQVSDAECIFYFNMHHIISDGWSMEVLAKDVMAFYNAYDSSAEVTLTPLRIQYKDYAAWQQEQLKNEGLQDAKAYWQKSLEAPLPILNLPSNKKRPTNKTFFGKRLKTYLPSALLESMKSFSQAQEGSLFSTVLTIWKVLFYQYTQEKDFIVATPAAGRFHAELEDQIGFYVNTLVLRNQVDPSEDFITNYQKIKENTLAAINHQAYPFDALVDDASLKRDTSRGAIFDVMIALQNAGKSEASDVKPQAKTIIDLGDCYAKFDLEINLFEENNHLALVVEYNKDVYDATLMKRMMEHFETLADSLLESPGRAIQQANILSPQERNLVLNTFNQTEEDYPQNKTVLDLFEAQVQATPQQTAIKFGEVAYAFKAFDQLSNQFATYLRATYQVRPNDLIGIQLERSERMPLAIISILKAGGAYVPMGMDYPAERVAYIQKDAKMKVIVTESILADFFTIRDQYSTAPLPFKPRTGDLAYCIYTSGSTGKPKGVLNQHDGLFNRLEWMKRYLNATHEDIFLQKTPYTFDVSVWEFVLPWITGGTLVMAKPEGHKDPDYLKEIIREESVSIIHFVPSMLGIYLQFCKKGDNPSLNHIICSGEELPGSMVEEFRVLFEETRIHNLYGPTEAAIDVTAIDVTEVDVSKGVSIGKPVANTRIYITDEALNPQPVGVPGELLIAGVQVAKGYLNLEEMTADRFIDDPFVSGDRVYKTGDIAAWEADGTIRYLGRKDNQVKIRGNRIELGEIENALSQQEGIQQAVAMARLVNGEKVLVAYLMPEANTTIDKTTVKTTLTDQLPEYMVPGYFVTLEEFPLTSSGKVNRKLLPEIGDGDVIKNDYVAPENDLEKELAEIWQDVLGVDRIGITDNFFDLGGHSLKAGKLINTYGKKFSVKLKLKDVFNARTVREHATLLETADKRDYRLIEKAPEAASYPLAQVQQMIWLDSYTTEGSISYNLSYLFHLDPDFDVNKFDQAVELLVNRHEILRTVFRADENKEIRQWILPPAAVLTKTEEEDISSSEDQEAIIKRFVYDQESGDLFQPFDLEKGPLFRFKLFKISKGYILYAVFHHLTSDGVSSEIIMRECLEVYRKLVAGSKIDLPTLRIQYKDYAVWQDNLLKADSINVDRAYWLERFKGKTGNLALPSKMVRPKIRTSNGRYLGTFLTKELTALCYQFGQENNGSLFITLLSIWNVLFYKYTAQKEIIIGTSIAGRNDPELEEQLGCYLNVLALLNEIEGDISFADFHEQVKENTFKAFEHQMYPFNSLIREVKVKKDISRNNPLYDVMLFLQNFEDLQKTVEDIDDAGTEEIKDYGYRVTKLDLEIGVYEKEEHIKLMFKFNPDVYSYDDICNFVHHFKSVAKTLLTNPNQKLNDVAILKEAQQQELLTTFNETETAYEQDKTVVDLFEERAVEMPDNIAVKYEEATYSYQELDALSNQLAAYLKENYSVKADDLVGIQLDRSERLPLAILAIMKAGGAYVPLGMDYPKERVNYIVKDAELKTLINEAELSKFFATQDQYSTKPSGLKPKPSDLAYCIYTSGSTGTPKGVLNQHAGLYNRLQWKADYVSATEQDVFLQKTPYTFDVSVWEFVLPLITGSTLVMAKPEGHKDPEYLKGIINEEAVNIIHFVPSMLGVFLQSCQAGEVTSLKHIVCSGEELPAQMIQASRELFSSTRIHNLYGPTEAAIDVTAIDVTDIDLSQGVSIGTPVPNTRIYIVDEGFNPQPIGVAGELLISGVQVAKGYLNLDDLNRERFIADPFIAGARVYRTGDIAAWNEDGTIKYLGRKDHQVKIRGNRIELGEIEAKLHASGLVKNAVVLVKESENAHKFLVAYVMPKEDYLEDQLFQYLETNLPDYMVPSRVMTLEEFPLTTSGKINRKGLPDLEDDQGLQEQYVAPRNDVEAAIAKIWEEVLTYERIGIRSNFFRIGGDSILSIRLISKINSTFQTNLTIAQLYEHNTIEELATLTQKDLASFEKSQQIKTEIEAEIDHLKQQVLASIDYPETIEEVYPMSDIQKGMVILSGINPQAGVYHDQFIYQIPSVDQNLFRKAFSKLVWKHECLRTQFDLTSYSKAIQIVKKELDFAIDYQDLTHLDTKAKEVYIDDYMVAERKNPFSIDAGLLWRISLFKISDTAMMFLFQSHHAILDGWSLASLNTELFQIYRQLEQGTPLAIEKLKATNKAAVLGELCDKEDTVIADFWKAELADFKKLDIFKNGKAYQVSSYTYDADFKTQLKSRCKIDGLNLKTIAYGAFVYALNNITYEDDFIVGMVANNRPTIEDGDKLLGCFLNTIPVRNRLENKMALSLVDYFKATEKYLTEIRKNERLTLYKISKLMNENATGSSPFFDVMFNYVNFHVYNALDLDKDETYKDAQEEEIKKDAFVLTNTAFDFTASALGDSFDITYKLKQSLKNDITVERIHHYVDQVLQNYLTNAEMKIGEISYLTKEEERVLLSEAETGATVYPSDKTILDLFDEQLSKTPNATAVVAEDMVLSYQALDERSNQLANYLRAQYLVASNELIGFMLPPSSWSIVSLLAILKTGAAYVPIDPETPIERVNYLIEETKLKTLIGLSENEAITQYETDFLAIDEVWADLKDTPKTKPSCQPKAEDLAYVIFTSGSTGRPKGVMITQANLVDYATGLFANTAIRSSKRFALMSNIATDLGNTVLYASLLSGGALYLPKKETLLLADSAHEYFEQHSIDCMKIVPSHWNALTKDGQRLIPNKMIVFGGDVLPVNYVEAIKKQNPEVSVINHYGPTETTIGKLLNQVELDESSGTIPIGQPFSQTNIYVVDKDLRLCPVGVPGELLIGGQGVAKGYLNNPDLTARQFIQNPFKASNGKVYRTGDLVRMLPNGAIEFIGRKDGQVKIRGHRIELGEVQSAIQASGLVENTVALIRTLENGRKQLTAFVIPKASYGEDTLYAALNKRLPDYMIPSRVNTLDAFPLTANGKINRKALLALGDEQASGKLSTPPQNEAEERLLKIWENVLEQTGLGVEDDFFRVGGDSLLIVKLKHELEKTYATSISIVDLFNHTTIEQQARLLVPTEIEEEKEITELKF